MQMLPEAQSMFNQATSVLVNLATAAQEHADKQKKQQEQNKNPEKQEEEDIEMDDDPSAIDDHIQKCMGIGDEEFKQLETKDLEQKRKEARDFRQAKPAKKPKIN